jgi:hypothetical protein
MAIEAVEAEAVREQTLATSPLRAGVSVTPSLPANQNGEVRHSLATLWAGIIRGADDGAPGRGEPMSDRREDGTDNGGHTWLTELLARASRGSIMTNRISHRGGHRRKTARQTGSVGDNAEHGLVGLHELEGLALVRLLEL